MENMKKVFKSILISTLILFTMSFFSCSGLMGYSVVLWNIPEHNIADGTIVPVYIKSNVSHVYVIGLPDTKEKIEVPLWQISEPQSKSKSGKLAQRYKNYEHQYARCVLDGLPIRSDKVNTAKQVYRLRKDEVIKPLYKGNGQAVMTGKNAIEGEWLKVITKNGTIGWCFSHNLRLFEMNADGTAGGNSSSTDIVEVDNVLETMLSTKWYPENYSAMIRSGNIDLAQMQTSFGFDTGHESEKISLKLRDIDIEYPFAGVTKIESNVYKFDETPLQVTVRGDNFIVVQYTDEYEKRKSYNFIALESDISTLIANEIDRRAALYTELRVLGPDFKSDNYGTLSFIENNSFRWTGYTLLVPSVIPRDANGRGKIVIQYFISTELKKNWDGVLTFKFDGSDEEINFLYKKESNGLRLENAMNAEMKGSTVISRASNSLVMFFAN